VSGILNSLIVSSPRVPGLLGGFGSRLLGLASNFLLGFSFQLVLQRLFLGSDSQVDCFLFALLRGLLRLSCYIAAQCDLDVCNSLSSAGRIVLELLHSAFQLVLLALCLLGRLFSGLDDLFVSGLLLRQKLEGLLRSLVLRVVLEAVHGLLNLEPMLLAFLLGSLYFLLLFVDDCLQFGCFSLCLSLLGCVSGYFGGEVRLLLSELALEIRDVLAKTGSLLRFYRRSSIDPS